MYIDSSIGDERMTKDQTNICKGIAIIMMYIHHLFSLWESFGVYDVIFAPFSDGFVVLVARLCKVCVAIFVFMTGYGYTKAYKSRQEGYKGATCRRYFKLMFSFWFIFILSMCTSFLGRNPLDVYGRRLPELFLNFFFDMMGISTIMGTPEFNVTWWYMSYAVLLVFITPLLIKVVKKLGIFTIPLVVLFPRFVTENMQRAFLWYLLSLVLGICFAEFNAFEKLNKLALIKKITVFLLGGLIGALVCILRFQTEFYDVFDAYLAVMICCTVYCFISYIFVFNRMLCFIGKHSMNMFLTHTLIKGYYYTDFIYSFRYFFLILLVLLVITLILSVCIEQVKKWIKYDLLEKICCEHAMKIMNAFEKR